MKNSIPIPILTDSDIAAVDMSFAVECMEEAFRQHATGRLVAPCRLVSDVQAGQLVFTVGASLGQAPVTGFRCYDLGQLHSPNRSEVTAVLDGLDGHLRGLVIGPLLGAVRTGAIGGLAIKYLVAPDVRSLALLGTGYQARTQLRAALAVRQFETVSVFSREPERRGRFADEMTRQLGHKIQSVASSQAAVEDADVIICATTSTRPVVRSRWLKPGVHINNIGPKFRDGHELELETYQSAGRMVTDAPAQVEALGDSFVLHGSPMEQELEPLSTIVAASRADERCTAPDRDTSRVQKNSVFVSLGMAGTEVLLANAVFHSRTARE